MLKSDPSKRKECNNGIGYEKNDRKSLKRIMGKTPNGGAYSEIYFFDGSGNIADEAKASTCVIRECAENGDLIAETWGTV